jgi:NAD-dependent dihydropyrimidine dehydrogenase PreA subunit
MIEVVSQDRCVKCDVCVKVCPMDVFALGPDGAPVIARQDDCQTCFMCEAHCPVDAMVLVRAHSRSMTVTLAWPPPSHMVCRP